MVRPDSFVLMRLQDWNSETGAILGKSLYGGEDRRRQERLHRVKRGNDERWSRLSEGSEGLRTYTRFLNSFPGLLANQPYLQLRRGGIEAEFY